MRQITKSSYLAHTEPIFKQLKLLKLDDLYTIKIIKLYYRYMDGTIGVYLHTVMQQLLQQKNLTSRRLQLMEIPAIKYEYQIKADGWQVAKTTNSLNIIKYGKMANEIKTEIIILSILRFALIHIVTHAMAEINCILPDWISFGNTHGD
jgi:hypothetical protein